MTLWDWLGVWVIVMILRGMVSDAVGVYGRAVRTWRKWRRVRRLQRRQVGR